MQPYLDMSVTTLHERSLLRNWQHPNAVTFKMRLGEPSAGNIHMNFYQNA
jgi:hypothetical protein